MRQINWAAMAATLCMVVGFAGGCSFSETTPCVDNEDC